MSLAIGDLLSSISESGVAGLLREGLVIGAWVAMWPPLEVFLYDWWPIVGEARLFDRLGRMPVRIEYSEGAGEAWRTDWPATAAQGLTAAQQRTRRDNRSARRSGPAEGA